MKIFAEGPWQGGVVSKLSASENPNTKAGRIARSFGPQPGVRAGSGRYSVGSVLGGNHPVKPAPSAGKFTSSAGSCLPGQVPDLNVGQREKTPIQLIVIR